MKSFRGSFARSLAKRNGSNAVAKDKSKPAGLPKYLIDAYRANVAAGKCWHHNDSCRGKRIVMLDVDIGTVITCQHHKKLL